jgi:hypothetical protein
MQLLEQCQPRCADCTASFRRGLKPQSLAELLSIDDPRESRCNPVPIALSCRARTTTSVFLLPPISGASLLVYDRSRKHKSIVFSRDANRRALIGMEQNPEVKRMVQRSLFLPLVQKPLDLPIEKQQELQTAIAELLLTALPQNPMQGEANIDDDEQ